MTLIPPPRTAEPAPVRFKPTRAGVIGLWDYTDEEFVFADGRLVLRGHNGSGKTKALEVLFPLVLDGVLDARRLDPFSGEERTMKANLLYKGQDSGYGYVWMEFTRTAADGTVVEAVSVGIGMRVSKAQSSPSRFFFVTDGRIGIDFGLLDDASRPLRESALRQLVGDQALFDTAEAYREAIDARLFHLGRERYNQLVNLLLQLRRPLLAKDLDPNKLSDTLTAGLRPVDEDLILQAARDFENLAEIQSLLNALTHTNTAVKDFLRDYTTYLRLHARDRVDQVAARAKATADQCETIITAGRERDEAEHLQAAARQRQEEAERTRKEIGARLEEYKRRDAYQQQDGLRELRSRVVDERRSLAQNVRLLAQAEANLTALREETQQAQVRHEGLLDQASRHTRRLLEAARTAGILADDDTLDLGADLATDVTGRAAARRTEVADIDARLHAADEAARDQDREQDHAEAAGHELAKAEGAATQAADTLTQAEQTAARALNAFCARRYGSATLPVLTAEDADALHAALAAVGEPDAPALPEVFRSLTDSRRTTALQHRDHLQREQDSTAQALKTRRAERDTIAAQKDDAPPPSDLRTAPREGRPGAPLWQLVAFADTVDEETAGALEGALYGAGLLTAWLHPDDAHTRQALTDRDTDAYLRPLPEAQRPTGPTLADVLTVEEQDRVDAATVKAVLASIAVLPHAPDAAAARVLPAVTTGGHFDLGIQLGAHPKDRPEYIGATARAARRLERLRVLDEDIATHEARLEQLAHQHHQAEEVFADFDRALRELPRTQPVLDAIGAVAVAAQAVAGARQRHSGALTRLNEATARTHDLRRQLRHAAATARLPSRRDELSRVAQAIDDFTGAGRDLSACRVQAATAERDLTGRKKLLAAQSESWADQAAALKIQQEESTVQEARLATQEAALEAPLQEILKQIAAAEAELAEATKDHDAAQAEATAQRERFLKADHTLDSGRAQLTTAVTEQVRAALTLEPYARPDLLGLLEADTDTLWLPHEMWPSPEQAVTTLMDQLARPDTDLSAITAARHVLPASVMALIDALDAATRGRPVTATLLKTVTTKISTAITAFEAALNASDQGYLFEWEPAGDIILAKVTDSEGPAPVAEFARRLAEQLADQSVLLEDKERTVLEDGLLTGLAQQIHDRTVAARDLVKNMDADTRAKPMSSGTTVGIKWVISDALTDSQRAVNKLLDKDAAGLGPAGLAELRTHLRGQIRAKAAADKKPNYQQVIADVLDYRAWRKFELRLFKPGMDAHERETGELLTKAKHSQMSGGEKSASIHLPLFAAAHAQYSSAHPTCPRLIALDEAFAGIDEQYRPDLLALTAKFDLDLFMTGYDLWITYPQVPQISHYDMKHDEASHTVSAMLLVWDGTQILDDLGYPGSDELAAHLLGFTPRRHAPATAPLLDDPAPEPDDAPENA
ncbi:TIGR02680 family protein [Streptomyces sp. NPDC050085]|uniref:TIGR02680 family protein n=1 Tax=Streptomyces sp. NPDC050085 TaxID=3365600 RepID=UPI00379B4983